MQTDPLATPVSAQETRRAWVASVLMRRSGTLFPRFALALKQLKLLPRGLRRRLNRRAAVSLSGAALLLALSSSPLLIPHAHAATITVGGGCTLAEAITAANTNSSYGGCVSGSGVDVISLTGNVTLTTVAGDFGDGDVGLPRIESTITIDGNGFTISRDPLAPEFRLLQVYDDDNLTLRDVTLSGGDTDGNGGAVFLEQYATLTVLNSTFSGNHAEVNGGAIFVNDYADLSISGSTLSGNTADEYGGAIYVDNYADAIITSTTLSGNSALLDGGAIYVDNYSDLELSNSTLSGNGAGDDGGAIYIEQYADATITGSLLTGNTANYDGGAIFVNYYGQADIAASTLSGNSAQNGDGGAILSEHDTDININRSTLSGNTAGNDGGAVAGRYTNILIANSTLSGNHADDDGGGVHGYESELYFFSSTVSGNTADDRAGGIRARYGGLYLRWSIVSGNDAYFADEIDAYGASKTSEYNVLGHSAITNADAFYYFTPDFSDITATSDGTLPTSLSGILDTTLADNGGPTMTHALAAASPAIDLVPNSYCDDAPVNGVDQRGLPRGVDIPGVGNDANSDLCDAGAFEDQDPPAEIFVTTEVPGVTDDALAFGPHDVLKWDGTNWSKWFDGAAAGLSPTTKHKHNINAVWVADDAAGEAVFSFAQNARKVPGITPKVDGTDLVWWDGSAFSLWFDGSDVGLTDLAREKIDALHVLDGSLSPVGAGCDYYVLISTQSNGKVPGVGAFRGEDVLGFCLTNSGPNTTGVWHMLIDGSAEGMPANSTSSISFSDDGQTMYLTTRGLFNVDSAAGGHSEVYKYDFASNDFSGPFFVPADEGMPARVTGLHVDGQLP